MSAELKERLKESGVEEGRQSPSTMREKIAAPIRAAMMGAAALAVINACGDVGEAESGDEEVGEVSEELVASFPAFSTGYHQMKTGMNFSRTVGHRYTACLNPFMGDPDLYGSTLGVPTTSSYQQKSAHSGLTSDCFSFNASTSGTYYLGMYGFNVGSNNLAQGDIWVTDSLQNNVPSGFSKALTWPVPGFTSKVNDFSEFNTSWGNAQSANNPFFPNDLNYVHSGVDISVPAGVQVKAACSGPVKALGSLGNDDASGKSWGYYVAQDCTKNGTTISIAYDHLNSAGRPAPGSQITEGQSVGTIYDLQVPGEGDHLHLGICKDKYDSCPEKPQGGAIEKSTFPGKMINPWIATNPGLYK